MPSLPFSLRPDRSLPTPGYFCAGEARHVGGTLLLCALGLRLCLASVPIATMLAPCRAAIRLTPSTPILRSIAGALPTDVGHDRAVDDIGGWPGA